MAAFAAREAAAGFTAALKALPCRVVNHPDRVRIAENKPAQLRAAVEVDFTIPATIITNRVADARDFVVTHGPAVYKALRPPEIECAGEPLMIWTDVVRAADLSDSIAVTAHLFQEKVDKVADIRLTLVGSRAFAVRIDAAGMIDWRCD